MQYGDPEHHYTFPRFAGEIAGMVAGLLIWAAHLGIIYSVHAIACARGYADMRVLGMGLVPFVIGVTTLAAVIGSALVLIYALRDLRDTRERSPQGLRDVGGSSDLDQPERFLPYTTATIAGFSLLAITWTALPALFIPPCA